MRRSKLEEFPFAESRKVKSALILCHRHADVDAYCAAYGIKSLLKHLQPRTRTTVVAPEGLSIAAKRVQKFARCRVETKLSRTEADLVVVVDTGHAALIRDWVPFLETATATKIFVDHHPLSPTTKRLADHLLVFEDASSASEVVYRIFRDKGAEVSTRVAQALLAGIIFDSQHLTIARCRAVEAVADLCRKGANIEDVRRVLRIEREPSEIVARLKAAQRLRAFQFGRWIFAVTTIGSYHASAARALVELGAHIAFAVGEHEGETRGSLRSTQQFFSETGVHLGTEIAEKVSASVPGGSGGGHPTAASLTNTALPEENIRLVLRLLSDRLGHEPRKIS